MEEEGGSGASGYGNEMVVQILDEFSGNVAAVIVLWCELVSHSGGMYCPFIFF